MSVLDFMPREYNALVLLLGLLNLALCQPYFGFDPTASGPPMPPQPLAFPLQNSYVPNHYGIATPDYVFASYTQGGFKFQGPAPEADSEDSDSGSDNSAGDQGPQKSPVSTTNFGDTQAGPGFGYSSDADDSISDEDGDIGKNSLSRYRQKAYHYINNLMSQRRVKY